QRILNQDTDFWIASGEFVPPHRLLVLHGLIAPAHCDRTVLEITRPDLNSQRYTFLDPLPILNSAAEIAPIDFSLNRNIIEKFFRTQLRGEPVAGFQNFRTRIFLACDWQNND